MREGAKGYIIYIFSLIIRRVKGVFLLYQIPYDSPLFSRLRNETGTVSSKIPLGDFELQD